MNALDSMIGQPRIKTLLKAEIGAALKQGKPLASCLLYGPPGVGKSSVSRAIASTCGYELREWVVGKDWTPARIEQELFDLPVDGYAPNGIRSKQGTVYLLLLDEAHNLSRTAWESLYEPLQTGHFVSGGAQHWLPEICFCVATTAPSAIPKPARDRLGLHLHVDPYSCEDLKKIVKLRFPKLAPAVIEGVAQRCKGIPRVAIAYAERCQNAGGLCFFDQMGISEIGLDSVDQAYLLALQKSRRPMSLSTLSAVVGEPPAVLLEMVEPFLLAQRLIEITPQGRKLVASGRGTRGQ